MSNGFELAGVSLRLGDFALRDLRLAAAPGEILVLLGRNGAGKSVCLETIAGFHRPAGGRILIAGRDVTALPPERRRVAFLLQDFALFPHLTIAENVALAGAAARESADTGSLLARFGIAHLAQSRPARLSPGEKQRAALARALMSRPDLYLFDEPFAALDAETAASLRDELGGYLRRTGRSTVFVTHDRIEALALADRVAVIDGGAIRQQGLAAEVFARPKTAAVARLLGFENLIEARIVDGAGAAVRTAVGGVSLFVAKRTATVARERLATLAIRAEDVHLLPLDRSPSPNRLRARVLDLRRIGPLWLVTLDCGFPLVAYALPQTARATGLTVGGKVDAALDPETIHLVAEDGD